LIFILSAIYRPILNLQGVYDYTRMDNQKLQFVSNVQKWVHIDSQLKLANEKTKQMRDAKHALTEQICEYKQQFKDNTIELSDGNLKIFERKEYSPLSYGYLEMSLREIIQNDEHVDHILKYLRDNREVTVVRDIRRNITKESV